MNSAFRQSGQRPLPGKRREKTLTPLDLSPAHVPGSVGRKKNPAKPEILEIIFLTSYDMTFAEIFANEDANKNRIYLHKEGTFWRAHNQSAFLLCREVAPFKVSLKVIKKENREDYSVGFPEPSLKKFLYRYVVNECPDSDGKLIFCHAERPLEETEYENWCEMIRNTAPQKKEYSKFTKLIESQPVWKTSFDVLLHVLDVSANVSRRFFDPLGRSVSELALELCGDLRDFYDKPDREAEAQRLCKLCRKLQFRLYVLEEKRQVSQKGFAQMDEQLNAVHRQLLALGKRTQSNN